MMGFITLLVITFFKLLLSGLLRIKQSAIILSKKLNKISDKMPEEKYTFPENNNLNNVIPSDNLELIDKRVLFKNIHFNIGSLSFNKDNLNISASKTILQQFYTDNTNNKLIKFINIDGFEFIDCEFSDNVYFKDGLESLFFNNCIFIKRCYINNQYEDNDKEIKIKKIIIKN